VDYSSCLPRAFDLTLRRRQRRWTPLRFSTDLFEAQFLGAQQQLSSDITKGHKNKYQKDELGDVDFLGR
jgi:hypothetical protein